MYLCSYDLNGKCDSLKPAFVHLPPPFFYSQKNNIIYIQGKQATLHTSQAGYIEVKQATYIGGLV